MKILLVSFGLAAAWSVGPTLSGLFAADDPATLPAQVDWREMAIGSKRVVTATVKHGSLDFDAAIVRIHQADGKKRGSRYFRRMVSKQRRFYVNDIDGGVKVRFNAVGWGSNRDRDIDRIVMRLKSDGGARLGRHVHDVGSGSSGGGGSGR